MWSLTPPSRHPSRQLYNGSVSECSTRYCCCYIVLITCPHLILIQPYMLPPSHPAHPVLPAVPPLPPPPHTHTRCCLLWPPPCLPLLPTKVCPAVPLLLLGCPPPPHTQVCLLFPCCFWGEQRDMFGQVVTHPAQRGLYFLFHRWGAGQGTGGGGKGGGG